MSDVLRSEDGWMLAPTTNAQIDELMGWFADKHSVDIWGGPKFRYPFTRDSFIEDCRMDVMRPFTLQNQDQAMAAFGQLYERQGRGHLAHLISNPAMRRQGAGRRLIAMLMRVAREQLGSGEYSLFVYRDNEPAYRCYLAMGFTVQDYPDDAKMKDKCYFLTRSSDESTTTRG